MTQIALNANLDGIAIIGMSGRFPGAKNVDQLWQNLINRVDSISHFREDELEFSVATPAAKAQGQKFISARGVLGEVDQFDAAFFGIYPREAEVMDPQHRFFLECAWDSLESAGYDAETYPGLIGVYAGLSLNTYLLYNLVGDRTFAANFAGDYQVGAYQVMLGNDKDFMPTRVSYKLNLKGPSMAIQTACSTSLVAVCQACTGLLTYQCDMALAGGVSISFPQRRDYLFQEEGMVSGDGVCRTFEAAANGTVFGHGAAVVLLKRLADAVADGDNILAVIKGTAVNNDGSMKIGYAAPSLTAQADVIAMAQAVAGVDPESISYIEAHGTATPLGDPIEVAALTQAFRNGGARRNGYCALGAAKTNIGHLDVASGATSLIKTVLQLQHEQIPPLLHFKSPNPKIDFTNSPFFPVTQLIEWKRGETPRRAGVSAFGVGGTNAHVVIEEAPLLETASVCRPYQLFLLSAKTETALQKMAENLAADLEEQVQPSSTHESAARPRACLKEMADIAFTLQKGRKQFAHRSAMVVKDTTDAIAKLKTPDAKSVFSSQTPQHDPSVVFLFPGQGAQYVDMGRELYETESVFRVEVDRCAEILQQHLGLDIRQVLYPDAANRAHAEIQINETWVTQPAIFAVEHALARLWLAWGVKPAAVIGHSVGEYVCATLAETFTLEDALALLSVRAKLMQALPAGAMLSVRLGAKEAERLLPAGASVAALNSPSLCTVSGPTDVLLQFEKQLKAIPVPARFLPTSHAFHSAMMEPMLAEFTAAAQKTRCQPPKLRWVSTCTGRWMTPEDIADTSYWARQLRHAVRFSEALEAVIGETQHILLEVGPGQALSQFARQHPAKAADFNVIAALAPTSDPGSDLSSTLAALGKLWLAGVKPDWDGFYAGERRRRVPLPTYPFDRKRFWVEPVKADTAAVSSGAEAADELSRSSENVELAPLAPAPQSEDSMDTSTSRLAPGPRQDRLADQVRAIIHELSGIDVPIDGASFVELGLDSLFLTQASHEFQKRFGVKITFRQLIKDVSTVAKLAGYLDKALPPEEVTAQPPVTRPPKAGISTSAPLIPPSGAVSHTGSTDVLRQLLLQQTELMSQQSHLLRAVLGETSLQGGTLAPASNGIAARPAAQPTPPAQAANGGSRETNTFGPYQAVDPTSDDNLTEQQKQHLAELVQRYTRKTKGSKALTQKYRQWYADPRTASGFNPNWKEMVYQIVVVRSSGSRLWDIDGNEYVDLLNGFGPNFLGHSAEVVTAALREQIDKGIEVGPQSPIAGEAAKLFCELTGNERASFVNTGSEAVYAAMRLARTVTGRDKIVMFTRDYHGNFDEVLVRGYSQGGNYQSVPIAPGIPRRAVQDMYVLDYGSDDALDFIKSRAGEIAAVLVEPVQSRRPEFQPYAFVQELRRVTAESGSLLIFDEVVTGFRDGLRGAQALFGVQADIATYGKVVGGGMPIGVVAGKAEFMDTFDGGWWQYGDDSVPEHGVTFFAGTFVRHPLTMAAVHAMLKYLRAQGPEFWERIDGRAKRLATTVDSFFVENQAPMRMAYFHSQMHVRVDEHQKYANLLFFHLREKGVFLLENFPCYLTAAHTDEDVDRVIDAFKESVADMQAGGFLPASSEIRVRFGLPAPAVQVTQASSSERFPLSDAQREMWLGAQMSPEAAGPHHACTALDLNGDLDVSVLRRAIAAVIDRHEGLRCTFSPDGSEVICRPSPTVEIPLVDLSGFPAAAREARVGKIMHEEGRRLFDLTTGPLIAFQILKLSDYEHRLVFTAQMIVCDGWSHYVVFEELSAIYSAMIEGREALLKPVGQMHEFALWQQKNLDSEEDRRCEAFWLSQFKSLPSPLELPSLTARPPFRTNEGDRRELILSTEFYQELKQVASELKNSSFALLLAAFHTWLFRLSGATDLVVGVPFAGQGAMGQETLIGQCANILPLRAQLNSNEPFVDLLQRTWDLLLDAQENWNYTYGRLVQKLDMPPDPSRIPLVSVLFNIDPAMNKVRFSGLRHRFITGPRYYYQYDLGLNLVEDDGALQVECDYNSNLFDGDSINLWLGHLKTLLEGIVADPKQTLGRLPMVSVADRWCLTGRNTTDSEFRRDATTVHSQVSAQAARTPEAVAVAYQGQQLTYAELERSANQLGNQLRALGIGPGILVGVYLTRSLDMIVGVLGVLKAGGAYVPIDPDTSQERIAFILEDTAPLVLLTHASLLADIPKTTARLLCLDEDGSTIAQKSMAPPPDRTCAEDLAYVICTSGSTGKPQRVEIPHRAVVNLLESMRNEPGLKVDDVMLALTSLSFDSSVLELFLPLTVGARLVIVTPDILIDPHQLSEAIAGYGVTVMQATPATYRMLLNAGWMGDPNLRVLCGGEALAPDLADQLLRCCRELWNMYGATETTVWSAIRQMKKGEPVFLGHPIDNTRLHIVDDQLQPVAVGVPGELLIGGVGLARGYRNRSELTTEKFIPDPFAGDPAARLYRTGDLVRYRPNGDVEFLGRRDFQVKLRGYRIELGEIESILLSHPSVRDAAVLLREDVPGEPRLVAYLIAGEKSDQRVNKSQEPDIISELRQLIRRKLPDYMLPSVFVLLEGLPRTPAGKTDRLSLPAPTIECFDGSGDYIAPRNPTEETLARIWREILKVEKFGIRDSFFRLGGQSLLAVSLFARIEREFGKKLPLATLFRSPTVEQLAAALNNGRDHFSMDWASLVPIQPQGSKRPLFLVHGAGGNVLLYRSLAEHLAPDYPLYGLQSRGLDGKSAPLATIEEMAIEYLREIRTIQRKGPYYLGGYCLGGTVAYEMAQILHREGEEVALVAMLDTYNYSLVSKASFSDFLFQKLRFHLGNFARLRPREMVNYVSEKVRLARDGELANLKSSMPGSTRVEGVSPAVSGIEASVQAVNDHAADHYLPKPYPGRLTLFKPQINYKFYPDPNMGWGDLALGGLDIVELSMYPHAMLVQPFAGLLAAELKKRMEPLQGTKNLLDNTAATVFAAARNGKPEVVAGYVAT